MEKYRILSDFFAVPGLFCLFLGALRWLAGQGAFRGVGYILENTLRLLTFRERKPYAPKETKKNGYAVLLIIGAICLAAAGIFAGLFYGVLYDDDLPVAGGNVLIDLLRVGDDVI